MEKPKEYTLLTKDEKGLYENGRTEKSVALNLSSAGVTAIKDIIPDYGSILIESPRVKVLLG